MTDFKSSGSADNESRDYVPGMYHKEKPNIQERIEKVFNDWQLVRKLGKSEAKKQFPVICFSRKIGVGALEVADILSNKIGYHVIDREIMEYLASRKGGDDGLAELIDEHCLSEMEDIFAMRFGVKSYAQNEYSLLLFRAIFSFAALGPAIFVGRGAHLILPREQVLAVRLTCSNAFRMTRIARMLNISEFDAFSRLKELDEEQQRFFKRVYNIEEGAPEEYDITINRDFFRDPVQIAETVKTAFFQKFGCQAAVSSC
ncbi:MAG: cytidylate kinase-like family protein [Desulfobacteraceae bacterium]|nr:MAG: cytidylate kinase-like family protein [Desulfobacteraceae bacterium]